MTPEQIAKLIEENRRNAAKLLKGEYDGIELSIIMMMLENQSQMIEYLLERENERTGDGK